jgi:hypothetical protein
MTQDEFFAWQANQERNYELVDGLPVLPLKMMTGASRAHDCVVVNIIRELGNQLRGGPCKFDGLDARIELPAINASLALVDIYEGLDFEQSANRPG